MLKCLLADLVLSKMNLTKTSTFTFDWFKDLNKLEITQNESDILRNSIRSDNAKNNENEVVKANYDKIPGNHPKIEDKGKNNKPKKEKDENISSDEIDDDEEYDDEDEDSLEKKKKKEKEKINQQNTENFAKYANFKDDDDIENI